MPDWFVKRNAEGSQYPFHVRFGGCEYSLTEEELNEFRSAIETIMSLDGPGCIESDEYQDIVISNSNQIEQAKTLLDLIGVKKTPFDRKGF